MKCRQFLMTVAMISILLVCSTCMASGNTENCGLYWTAKIEAEEEDMRSYRCLCRYDESTGNVFITEVKGYIIDGGIPGKGFYMVDSDSHSAWVNEWGLPLGMGNKPFNLYYYSKEGEQLVYENIYYEDLIKVVAYWDGVLWYIDNYGKLAGVELASGTRQECISSLIALKNEWINTVLPNGYMVGCINRLPELENENISKDLGPGSARNISLPALALQDRDGKVTILVMDEGDKYETFESEYYDPISNCIYYSAKPYSKEETGCDAITDIYRYSLADGSNTLCMIDMSGALNTKQFHLDTWFVFQDGERIVFDVGNIVDYFCMSATEEDGFYIYNPFSRETMKLFEMYEAKYETYKISWDDMLSFGYIE